MNNLKAAAAVCLLVSIVTRPPMCTADDLDLVDPLDFDLQQEGDGCSDPECPVNCNVITDRGYGQKDMSATDIGKLYFPLDLPTSQSKKSAVWYNLKGCKFVPKERNTKYTWNVDDYVTCLANKGQPYGRKCTEQMLKDGDECLMEHPDNTTFPNYWCRREPAKMKDIECPCHVDPTTTIQSYIDNQLTQTFEGGWADEIATYEKRKRTRDSFNCQEGEDDPSHCADIKAVCEECEECEECKRVRAACGRAVRCSAGGFSFSPERLKQVKSQMLKTMKNCVEKNCQNALSIDNLLDADASFGGGSYC